jgi:hypothetical protein
MLSWAAPRFALHSGSTIHREPSTAAGTQSCLISSDQPPRRKSDSAVSPPPSAEEAAPSKKIVMVDDTEMLRIFVEEVLTTADPSISLVTAADGGEGVSEVAATCRISCCSTTACRISTATKSVVGCWRTS